MEVTGGRVQVLKKTEILVRLLMTEVSTFEEEVDTTFGLLLQARTLGVSSPC